MANSSTASEAMAAAIRVVTIDDSETVVAGIVKAADGSIEHVEWCPTAAGGAAVAIIKRPDVATINLGGIGNAWRAIREIHDETSGEVPVLIVTGGYQLAYADLALEAGASGIATKAGTAGEIVAAIQRVAEGAEYWDHPWSDRITAIRTGQPRSAKLLTDLEVDIVTGVVKGAERGEIADRLGVTKRTVQRHLSELRDRVAATNDMAMVTELLKRGVIDVSALM
ncbi:MAG: LuxR C-terminal-related transcriptional regulator [Planctomycetota bacterium]